MVSDTGADFHSVVFPRIIIRDCNPPKKSKHSDYLIIPPLLAMRAAKASDVGLIIHPLVRLRHIYYPPVSLGQGIKL